eukprot:scaffold105060_cov24-Prasinocladus_malaysianus.AAC.1
MPASNNVCLLLWCILRVRGYTFVYNLIDTARSELILQTNVFAIVYGLNAVMAKASTQRIVDDLKCQQTQGQGRDPSLRRVRGIYLSPGALRGDIDLLADRESCSSSLRHSNWHQSSCLSQPATIEATH